MTPLPISRRLPSSKSSVSTGGRGTLSRLALSSFGGPPMICLLSPLTTSFRFGTPSTRSTRSISSRWYIIAGHHSTLSATLRLSANESTPSAGWLKRRIRRSSARSATFCDHNRGLVSSLKLCSSSQFLIPTNSIIHYERRSVLLFNTAVHFIIALAPAKEKSQ